MDTSQAGSNEYPQSMFLSRNKKTNIYSCKTQFYYIKVGFSTVLLYKSGVQGGQNYIGTFLWWYSDSLTLTILILKFEQKYKWRFPGNASITKDHPSTSTKRRKDEEQIMTKQVPCTVITLSIGANRPLQTVYVASDQGLHCLPYIQQYLRHLKR